jgi:hypothetical protein
MQLENRLLCSQFNQASQIKEHVSGAIGNSFVVVPYLSHERLFLGYKIALILVVFSHVYALFDHHTHIPRNTYHSLAITLRNVMEMRRPFPSGTECSQSFRAGPDKIYLEPCRG